MKNVDRLSGLPQGILHLIFSSIDTKLAVQTCILSKSWKNFWKFIPFLNFHGDNMSESFQQFIDKVLILHENPNLQSFRLSCESYDYVDEWILAALKKNVEEIYVHLDESHPDSFPESLFNSNSLTILELKFMEIYDPHDNLKVPDLVNLPQLKTLVLENFWILNDDMNNCISSCPVLESLSLIGGDFGEDSYSISSESLKHLVIRNCNNFQNSYVNGYNIKINAPNVLWFSCQGILSAFSIENLSSLSKAEIEIEWYEEDEEDEEDEDEDEEDDPKERMMTFLRGLQNAETLTLLDKSIEVVSRSLGQIESETAQFFNLKYLKLQTCLSRKYFDVAEYFFKVSPNIESLHVEIEKEDCLCFSDPQQEYPLWDKVMIHSARKQVQEAGAMFEHMHYHLKFVEVRGFEGRLNELMFLGILLKNAMVLEKIVLYVSANDLSSGTKIKLMKFIEELLILPTSSGVTIKLV